MNLIHMHKYLIIMQNYWNNLPHKHLLLNLQAHTHRTQVTLCFTDITTNAGIFRTNRRNLCVLQLPSQQMQQIFPCSTRFWSTKCSKSSRALPALVHPPWCSCQCGPWWVAPQYRHNSCCWSCLFLSTKIKRWSMFWI